MTSDTHVVLRLKPFIKGPPSQGRSILRTTNGPSYLSVSAIELQVIEEMAGLSVSLESFVKWHLAGKEGLTFREAMQLLFRLHNAKFLEEEMSREGFRRLDDLTKESRRPSVGWGIQKVWDASARLLDIGLVDFNAQTSRIPMAIRRGGEWITSFPALLAMTVFMAVMLKSFPTTTQLGNIAFRGLVAKPEVLAGTLAAAIWAACLGMSLLQLIALAGTRADFMPGSFRITAFCIFRLSWHDDDPLVLSRGEMFRYYTFCLLAPWTVGVGLWNSGPSQALKILACAFFVRGLAQICPLFRSPLIKIAEGGLAMLDILQMAKQYLDRGIFKSLILRGWSAAPGTLKRDARSFEDLLAMFACITLLWLYGVSLLFADALINILPSSMQILTTGDWSMRRVTAGIIVATLSCGVLMTALRLVLVIAQNFASVTELPVRKARRELQSFYRKNVEVTDSVLSFLKEIPIFSHLDDGQLLQMINHLKQREFRKGALLMKQGEAGDQFFVVANGEAEVYVDGINEKGTLVGILKPGDSVGEIALIDQTPRSASVVAKTKLTVFVLERSDFDTLFVEGSEERGFLTYLIRRVKLILESQALSHLSPSEIREVLRCSESIEFAKGKTIVSSGDPGDAVYVIESGLASVQFPDGSMSTSLEKGDLIGVIAVIKGINRTANVIAETDVSCLKINRAIFLSICMANVAVAMLVADMSDKQLIVRKAA